MLYLKAPGQGPSVDEPRRSWGKLTRYLEIGEDGYAVRHVDVYENGHVLRFDRTHWVDNFGMLADMRYNPKKWEKWWGPSLTIEAAEFDEVWRAAEASPTWRLQLDTPLMDQVGKMPIWLRRRSGSR